jgi:hypothetical protein
MFETIDPSELATIAGGLTEACRRNIRVGAGLGAVATLPIGVATGNPLPVAAGAAYGAWRGYRSESCQASQRFKIPAADPPRGE